MARMIYVDALKYLHGGLPADMSQTERQSLQAFIPSLQLDPSSDRDDLMQRPGQKALPSSRLIRSSTASIVTFLIALFMLAMPILAALINKLLEYERKHHITERLVNTTGQIVRLATAKSVTLGGQMVSLSQRQSSTYATISMLGLIHSVVDGVSDGIEHSLNSRTTSNINGDTKQLCDS